MGKKYDEWKARVHDLATKLNSDGCSSSPDFFYQTCCEEHDIVYRTGVDESGKRMTRAKADKQLFNCMRKAGKTPIVGRFMIPVVYWTAVRLFGRKAWNGNTNRTDGET